MDKLLFLSNELMNPSLQKEMHLPFTFIGFGIVKGKMYKHFRNNSTFITPVDSSKRWGNDVVYGGMFLCKDFDFYARILDAYHVCSLSTMRINHTQDIHHRTDIQVTPIFFNTLDELASLKYNEEKPITAQTYVGNLNHPKINQRFITTASYRIVDGIDAKNFKQLFGEVIK